MEEVLVTRELTKRFGKQLAVNQVSLRVKQGEIYAFLGQNGAGKTTTIRMIMGLIAPASGEIRLFGELIKPGAYRHFGRIGALLEPAGFYPNLTAAENLEIQRRLMGVTNLKQIDTVLALTGIMEAKNKVVGHFSLGMKQRLGIARALLHQPEFLILDEPANGLDPIGIKEVRQLILDLAQRQKITVFMSSHLLSEVQQLANTIGVIHQGKLLEEIDYRSLQEKNRHYLEIKVNDEQRAAVLLEQQLQIADYRIIAPGVVRIYGKIEQAPQINRVLVAGDLEVKDLTVIHNTLEDYFVRLTGGAVNE